MEAKDGATGVGGKIEETAAATETIETVKEDTQTVEEEGTPKPVEGAEGTGQEALSEETKEKLEKAKQKTLNALNKVKDTLDGLTEYRSQLHQMMDEQLMLENQMIEAVENTRRMRARIRAEQERIAELKAQIDLMEPEEDGDGRQV